MQAGGVFKALPRVIGLTELDLSATCVDVCASVLVIEILVLYSSVAKH